jgi:predicted methyltransferase
MLKFKGLLALTAGAIVMASAASAAPPANVTAALADPARPAEDVARDAARKPGDLLALMNVKPGAKVADFVIGGGYFTRILSAAVGPTGHVYAYQPAEFIAYQASYGENLKKVAGAYKNVTPLDASFQALDLPDGLDAIITVQNYHDLYLKPFPVGTAAKVDAELFKSLKPGGVFLVVDHQAVAGSGTSAADSLHRIDPEAVKKDLTAAGFKLESESKLLANAADPHTASVFDASIRGKTDQFILVFRKPK